MVTTAPAIECKTTSEVHEWRLRDFLAAAALFLGSAGFVLWQNLRVAVLWDLAYLLDSSYRMALGQMPYRDFPFVHPPLTFLIQAGLMRLLGRHFLVVAVYAAAASGAGTVIAWRLFWRVSRAKGFGSRAWWLSLLLAAPLTVLGIYAIYPHPIYDGDAALAILVALLLLTRLGDAIRENADGIRGWAIGTGAACVLPVFFKQNMGLPFLLAVLAGVGFLAAWEAYRADSVSAGLRSPYALVLVGAAGALVVACGLIAATAGLGNYLHWTVQFAAQRRMPGSLSTLAVYAEPQLGWMLPVVGTGLVLCRSRFAERSWGKIAAFGLIVAPFVAVLLFFVVRQDMDQRADELLLLWPLWMVIAAVVAVARLRRGISLGAFMPFFVLAAIHGTFLSQKLWGSSYAIWALLLLLVVHVLAVIPGRKLALACAGVGCGTLLVCGGLYAHSLERLNYIQFPEEARTFSHAPALRGMSVQGGYLRDLDELIGFAQREIPRNDVLMLLPGEDPFYFATGRAPQFPVLLFDPTTDPYSPEALMTEARRRGVRWVIVKRKLQLCDPPFPDLEATVERVRSAFTLYRQLDGYDVYRSR